MLRESPQRSAPARTGPRGLTGWHDVCRLNEIRPGRARPVLFNGTEIAIFRDEDDVFALGGTCPHRGGPLGSGTVAAGRAVCPLHGREFDLRTGISPHDPRDQVATYRCRVVAGTVQIDADSVPAGPGRPDGYLGRWARRGAADRGMALIQHLAAGGAPVGGSSHLSGSSSHHSPDGAPAAAPSGATARAVSDDELPSGRWPSWRDLTLRPAPLTRPPLGPSMPVDAGTVLGPHAARPLRLRLPLLVAAREAISSESRLALARGAAEAGTAVGSAGHEQGAAGAYLLQLAAGDPVPESELARADAVELQISPDRARRTGFSNTPELAGIALTTPAGYATAVDGLPDYPSELRACIAALRTLTGGVPIGLRIAAGDLRSDLAVASSIRADFVTIETDTGVGLPAVAAIAHARRLLGDRSELQLVAAGDFRTPDEMAKALALGADALALDTAALIAMGCQQYRACEGGSCPVGIATHQAELRLRFNADISAHRLATFLRGATEAIGALARTAGRHTVAGLCRDDLVALTPDAAAVTGLPHLL